MQEHAEAETVGFFRVMGEELAALAAEQNGGGEEGAGGVVV